MKIDYRIEGSTLHIFIKGDLIHQTVNECVDKTKSILSENIFVTSIVFGLKEVRSIDSMGIGYFAKLKRDKIDFEIRDLSPINQEIFNLTKTLFNNKTTMDQGSDNNSVTLVFNEDIVNEISSGFYQRCIDQISKKRELHRLNLDLEKVNYVDSVGLSALVKLSKDCKDKNVDLEVVSVSKPLSRIFRFTRLDTFVKWE